MKIGYARVSTQEQSPQLQIDALTAAGVEVANIYIEYASGATMDRPRLRSALDHLREGDAFVVYKLDRFARSTRDLLTQLQAFDAGGVQFVSLTEALDTSTPVGRLLYTIMAALGEFERDLIRERTVAGLEAARRQNRRGGRPAKITAHRKELAAVMRAGGSTLNQIAAALGISRSTVIRMLTPQDGAEGKPAGWERMVE